MSFTYPLGLLGLIGIPILIILYIIKNHYTEQTVASVYLWQLSERFLKRKKRVRLGGLLCLLLEIVAVAAISLTIAGPTFVLPDAAQDHCFILDASGSMMADRDGTSRFEVGKASIRKIIEQAENGSTYSLIVAGDTTFEAYTDVHDKETALSMLDSLTCTWNAGNCADALSVAQTYYTDEHSPVTYLVTDRPYETEHIKLINVAPSEENYALVSYGYSRSVTDDLKSRLTASGEVISYDRDANITIELYVEDEKCGETVVSVEAQVATAFEIEAELINDDPSGIRVVIANRDSLMTDNEGILYSRGEVENNKTLLISDTPAYLEFALRASGKTSVDVITTGRYAQDKNAYEGYGLYIFDSFTDPDKLPDTLPEGATIWLIGLKKSITGSGFGFREVVEAEGKMGSEEDAPEARFEPTYTTSTASFAKTMTAGLIKQQISLKKYVRYVPNRTFTSLLDMGSDSLIFLGDNENGDRQVVFSFDLHDSDLPLKADFLMLMDNLLEWSFPTVLEQTLYTVGDEVTVNVPAGCTDLLLTAPSGKIVYPDISSDVTTGALTEAGTYTLTATVGGVDRIYRLFVRLPGEESYGSSTGTLSLEPLSERTAVDGIYDKLILYFLILAVALILDWGVYCYEQYQLR